MASQSDSNKGVQGGAALWHGRFAQAPAQELMEFTQSLSFDRQLWPFDIIGSLAHVHMLGVTGVLSSGDAATISEALIVVRSEFETDEFVFLDTDEDIHTAIERRVTQLCGDVGGKLHTARSRNDQVVTALRLWCKHNVAQLTQRTLGLVDTLVLRAQQAGWDQDGIYLPGYTHLQRAQPILLAHHLGAHAWSLLRDVERLQQTLERLDVSPLGAGALAGSSLPIDPVLSAAQMGFAKVFANSLDAVSDRDFVAEILFDIALLGTHLSRMGEEWVLWTTEEFGFAQLDDSFATGSSMLPQKKNADIAELARGKTGRLVGNLTAVLVVLKGLPLAYNRDLQEDKEPLFDSMNQVSLALSALTGMIASATFNPDVMAQAADAEALAATDLAEWLVRQGMPFRQAHAVIGELVRVSNDTGASLKSAAAAHPSLGAEAAKLVGAGVGVRQRKSPGAAGPAAAWAQQQLLRQEIDRLRNISA
ncbi:MAG: argininosuccinate lyase [Ilumatobacteraceae bacterium]|nr:argininosuccinate lyase [Ilumatobacteraceae bacterium]